MRKITLIALCTLFLLPACQKQQKVTGVSTEAIPVNTSLDAIQDTTYMVDLAPITADLEREMNVQIGYAPEALDRKSVV